MVQPPPPAAPQGQLQIVPWLAQPLTPLLWVALGVTLLVALAMLIGFRRSTERCPISPRWLAVGTVVTIGLFAALSFGGQLANPVIVYAAPLFILTATLVAYAAWHAEGDPRRAARVHAAALATGSALATVCLLGCLGLIWLSHKYKDPRLDLDLGLGIGEAVAHLLPAVGVVALPLMLLPVSHPRTAAARRAVTAFAGVFVLILGLTAVAGVGAMSTPLPDTAALADKYIDINAAISVPPLLGSLCALVGGIVTFSASRRLRLFLALVIAGMVLAAGSGLLAAPAQGVLGLAWWQPAACVAMGLIVGLLLGALPLLAAPMRALLTVGGLVACIALGGAVGARLAQEGGGQGLAAANDFTAIAARLLAVLGLFAVSVPALGPAAFAGDAPVRGEPIGGPLATACLAIAMLPVCACTLRTQLTYQARLFSSTFAYESNRQVDPEMRSILQNGQHAVHIAGARWAWVIPQSIWWVRDNAWRDALIVADYMQPHTGHDDPTGTLYQGIITGASRKRDDVSFTDAQYVALVKPVPVPQKSPIIHTVAVRFATPTQVWGWARLAPSNPRVWLGLLVSFPAAWWFTRRARSGTAAAVVSAVAIAALALLAGVAGVFAFLAGVGLLTLLTSVRRDDAARCPGTVLTVMGVAAALIAVVIPLADVL